jgi:hypothetical protein
MVACETDERTFTTGPTQAHPDRPVETHVEPKASAEPLGHIGTNWLLMVFSGVLLPSVSI